ncbi:MAG: hypothetical protein F6K04_18320 [Leptolyngbya sp. SIO4C5]|nr:hypothetical protein [Leptolyngbya sp. SIO4C5]
MTHPHVPNNDLTQETNRAALETEEAAVNEEAMQPRADEREGYVYASGKDAPRRRISGFILGIAAAIVAVLAIGLFVAFRSEEPATPPPALESP